MRAVLVVHAFPRLSETFIVSKFLGLLDAGVDVHVLCKTSDEGDWERFPALAARPDARARVHKQWPSRPRWLGYALAPLAVARCLFRAPGPTLRYLASGRGRNLYLDQPLLLLSPDLVHFEFGPLAVDRMHVKELLDTKAVVSFRGYDLNFVALDDPSYYDAVWQGADAVHCLGEDLWQRAQRRGCPPELPHALISPAIDAERFLRITREPRAAGEPLRLLGVARLTWSKGQEYILEAVRLLRDRGVPVHLTLVGGGPSERALRFAIHQLGIGDVVEMTGSIKPAEVDVQLAAADVFVHASVAEGFCNAVIEAQASGLPVVCSDSDGLPENVEHEVTGFVVSRRDARGLADRIAQLAGDPALRRRMGEAGRDRVRRRFRLDDQIRSFLELYRTTVEAPPAPTAR